MGSNNHYLRWFYTKAGRRIKSFVYSKLYCDLDRDIRKSIFIAGTARSGTTWLADIFAAQGPSRIMFEPFHSKKVEGFGQFHYFQYMRPDEPNESLASYCRSVFTGEVRDSWVDRQVECLHPEYRVVKEIRANLFLKWIRNHFQEIPLIFIIRHPCAVVLSRMKLDWATDSDIESFLSQPKLVDDYLADKLDVINQASTAEEKHALIWCISNLIPLKQFHNDGLHLVFYEDLCMQPEIEVRKLFEVTNQPYQESVLAYLNRPSTTSLRTSAVVTGKDKVTHWQDELSFDQIRSILFVVKAFGLDYIYGDSLL